MPLKAKPMRYAHSEGHTDICYSTGKKGGIITCGSDGDVRTWLDLTDDDPASGCISEEVTSIISKGENLYAGNDSNNVQILNYNDLEKVGFLTRFSAPVTALATTKNSNLIVSGSSDMLIHVTNIETKEDIVLSGHQSAILGLSLDPKEEYVASSSADGTIKVWNIKENKVEHVWNNIVPKCNSFFTAIAYCTPSFHCKDGSLLAYPHGKDVVFVERLTWNEAFRLKCVDLKMDLSICKFSECGTLLAASSLYGEVAVWNVNEKRVIGCIPHPANAKITGFAWHLEKPEEISFCDATGQMGGIEIADTSTCLAKTHSEDIIPNEIPEMDNDDDDSENVISLNKIKESVDLDYDNKSLSDSASENKFDEKASFVFDLQEPFQPGSSPIHLLSRYMVWNDVGIVTCYNTDGDGDSSIEVEFNDVNVHHSMHITNFLNHTLAALSPQALALSCTSTSNKIVVVALQGWGTGNKEWTIEFSLDEKPQCLAAGDNFVAVTTTKRFLRLFTVGGTQREVVSIPGEAVCMNAYKNHLAVAYHAGVGGSKDQCLKLMWIKISGRNLQNRTIDLPLSPSSKLAWLGFSEACSPTTMDTSDIIRVYKRSSSLWMVACDMSSHSKNVGDHYFIIGVSEYDRTIRAVLCKGSFYPPTSPRPYVTEVPITIPLCEPDTEKTEKESKLWQLGSDPVEEESAMLALVAFACRKNMEYRVVDLCQQIAPQKVIELAIKYASRINRQPLVNKLQSIAESKNYSRKEEEEEKLMFEEEENSEVPENSECNGQDELDLASIAKKVEFEIKPLPIISQGSRRSNPFLKTSDSTSVKGLAGLDSLDKKPTPVAAPSARAPAKPKQKQKKISSNKESFVSWFAKKKSELQEEYPELNMQEITKKALSIYKEKDNTEKSAQNVVDELPETKKRKLNDSDDSHRSESSKSMLAKLAKFAHKD